LRVSRKMIRRKASEILPDCEDSTLSVFKASRGWLDRFLERNELAVRRRTTIAQKEPEKNDRKNDIVHTVHGTR